jgi:DNA modification methylase
MKINEIYLGDCLELMPKYVDDKSVDMIFCDLPYGTTACKWDTIIPFDKLWSEYERLIKDNGVIVLFGNEPFSSVLRTSNLKLYRYDWIWEKTKATGFQNSKIQPMRKYENLSVFYKHKPTYNPQGLIKKENITSNVRSGNIKNEHSFNTYKGKKPVAEFTNYPTNIVKFKNASGKGHLHPTMKPLSLIEYMIKTYTNEGNLILDNTCGSGTTGLGAKNLNRNFIMMEQDPEHYETACKRVLT